MFNIDTIKRTVYALGGIVLFLTLAIIIIILVWLFKPKESVIDTETSPCARRDELYRQRSLLNEQNAGRQRPISYSTYSAL